MSKSLREKLTALLESNGDLVEKGNVGNWLEAKLHSIFTSIADEMFGDGFLTRAERIILSGAIGDALDAFNTAVEEDAPHLYDRGRWDEPPMEPTDSIAAAEAKKAARSAGVKEPAKLDACVKKLMAKGTSEDSAWAICRASLGEGKMPKDVDSKLVQLAKETLGVREAATLETEFIPLVERAVRNDGTIPVKLIQPGWGASGYYPPEVLERDGPKLFTPGVKMYWNHPTLQEEVDRPEGDLWSLAAELVSPARWSADHESGPGLYTEAKVFDGFKDAIDDLAEHIGVSIRARGKATHGEMEGRRGRIIQEITDAKSVDFVTSPGAGGQILELFESHRGASKPTSKENRMTDELEKQLKEAQATIKTLEESKEKEDKELREQVAGLQSRLLLNEASDFAAIELAKSDLPQSARNRILRDVAKNPPLTEQGRLDVDPFKERIAEEIKAELAYIESLTGGGSIRGMGSGDGDDTELTEEQAETALTKAFARLGMQESAAKVAAKGR